MKKAMNLSALTLIMNGVSILALLFMIFSLFCYQNVNNKVNTASEQRYELTYNANRFMNGSAYLTNEVRAYAATGSEVHYDNYWNEVNNLKNRDLGVAAMKEIGITSQEQEMIDEMSNLSNTLVPLEEEAMNDVKAGRRESALRYVYGDEYSDAITKINALKTQFLETLDHRALTEVQRLIGVSKFIRFFLFLSIFLIGALQAFNQLIVRKRILRPVIGVRDQMGCISKGDLSAEFTLAPDTSEIGMLVYSIHTTKQELKKYISDIDSKLAQMAEGKMDLVVDCDYQGEFIPIQNAMSRILDSLNHALSQIGGTTAEVFASSEQVAASAQELSRGVSEQDSAVEELSTSIKQLSDEVHKTAEDAKRASSCSVEAAHQLKISNESMDKLNKAMHDISNASNQIGGIIKAIEDIAFQTNILALNAAVEAARAGEAGKGFAVVADEVRNLSVKSSEAAQNTTTLIENTLSLVEQAAQLSSETTDALLGVVSGAKQATDLTEGIAASSAQQAGTLTQLTEGVEQISRVVQSNAISAQQSAGASERLNHQAQTLRDLTERFTLRRAGEMQQLTMQ